MRKRMLEILMAMSIVIVGIIGVILQIGIFSEEGFQMEQLCKLSSISTILLVLYEMMDIHYMRRHKKGMFAAVLNYSVFVLFTFQFIFGQLLLRPYYAHAEGQLKLAYTFLHVILPILVYGKWLVGEKGHYYAKFLITASFVPIIYCVLELLLGQSNGYAYRLIDVNTLGLSLVVMTMVFLYVLYLVYGIVIVLIDRMLYNKTKKQK